MPGLVTTFLLMRTAQPISPRDRRYRHFLRIFIGSSLPKAALSHTAGLNRWTTHEFEAQFLVSPWKFGHQIELKPNILCEKVAVVHIKIIENTSYTHMFDVNIDARWCEKTRVLMHASNVSCISPSLVLSWKQLHLKFPTGAPFLETHKPATKTPGKTNGCWKYHPKNRSACYPESLIKRRSCF